MNPLKVVYILSSTTVYGGASKSFLTLLTSLRAYSIQPTVVVPDKDGLYEVLQTEGVDVAVLDYRQAVYPPINSLKDALLWLPRLFGRITLNHRATKQIEDICRKTHADLIHTNVSVIDIGYHAARHLGIPHIWHIREYADRDFRLHYYPCKAAQRARYQHSYTICITRSIQAYHRLTNNRRMALIYNAIASEPIEKKTTIEPYLLYAGHIEAKKGLLDLLKAYKKYAEQSEKTLPLYVAGGVTAEQYMQEVQRFIQANKLDKHILFLGEREDIAELEANATAVIIPSWSEAFGRVMPETMLQHTPVIARNTAGSREQMDNGKTYTGDEIALRYDTKEQLTALLKHVTNTDKVTFQPMTDRAYAAATGIYSAANNAEQTYNLYKQILHL